MKNVLLLIGAGQIGMAIARRMGYGMKIVIGDKRAENDRAITKTMCDAGFDAVPMETDLSSRESIRQTIAAAEQYGSIQMLVNAAGVSPSQASVETILRVDLYGTAMLLEEMRTHIAEGGVGVTISSQSGFRMPQLTAEEDALLAETPAEELLSLEMLQPEKIRDTLHAYQLAKRCNEKTCHGRGSALGRTWRKDQRHCAGHYRHTACHRRIPRRAWRILSEYVRQVSGGQTGNGRRSGKCGRTADESEGRIYYRFHIFDGRRRNSIVFLRTAETGSGINSDEI